jgi:hypothetical protein
MAYDHRDHAPHVIVDSPDRTLMKVTRAESVKTTP